MATMNAPAKLTQMNPPTNPVQIRLTGGRPPIGVSRSITRRSTLWVR